jgi:hypothetical protein
MSIEKRRFIRFSLDLPAYLFRSNGEVVNMLVRQVSIGGCLVDDDDEIFTGDDFRLEIELPNKNRLPLLCKALYKFEERGIGAKFQDITRFEQQLLAELISYTLEGDGLPLMVDPFTEPPTFVANPDGGQNSSKRRREDEIVEKMIAEN